MTEQTEQEIIFVYKNGQFGIVKLVMPVIQDKEFDTITFGDKTKMVRKYMTEDNKVAVYQEV